MTGDRFKSRKLTILQGILVIILLSVLWVSRSVVSVAKATGLRIECLGSSLLRYEDTGLIRATQHIFCHCIYDKIYVEESQRLSASLHSKIVLFIIVTMRQTFTSSLYSPPFCQQHTVYREKTCLCKCLD